MPTNVITYATTDGTRWGAGKGAPLTAHEHDESHFALSERVRELEDNPPVAVSIASVTQSGVQLTFHLSNGGALAPVTLPVAVFQERGSWRAGRDYRNLDIVRVGGFGRYMVIKDHHSEAPFDPDRIIGGDPVYYLLELAGVIFGDDIEDSRELIEGDLARYHSVIGNSVADPVEITIPEESTDFPVNAGDSVQFETAGVDLSFTGGATAVIIRGGGQARTSDGSVVTLLYKGNDSWILSGDVLI